MANENKIKTRVQMKADTAENWAKAEGFTPLTREPIFYTDTGEIKLGDGKTNVNDLPTFIKDTSKIIKIETKEKIVGIADIKTGDFVTSIDFSNVDFLNVYPGNDYEHVYNDIIIVFEDNSGIKPVYTEDWGTLAYVKDIDTAPDYFDNEQVIAATCDYYEVGYNKFATINKQVKEVRGPALSGENPLIESVTLSGTGETVLAIYSKDFLIGVKSEIVIIDSKVIRDASREQLVTTSMTVGKKTVDGGEIFNDEKNIAIGIYSHAEGNQVVAGSKAYNIVELIGEDSYKLDSIEGLEIGDTYTVKIDINYYAQGIITDIDITNNIVVVTNRPSDALMLDEETGEIAFGTLQNSFKVDTKPELGTKYFGIGTHAEGRATLAGGDGSHAEGYGSHARGRYSHAEGLYTTADYGAHSEGANTTASGTQSHAEGSYTVASDNAAHAEGIKTHANNQAAHAEGMNTKASGQNSHAEGNYTQAWGESSHIEGYSGRTYDDAMVIANKVVSEDQETYGSNQHILEVHTISQFALAKGDRAHVEGQQSLGLGIASHAEGLQTKAIGSYGHSEGMYSSATGSAAHAEGSNSTATAEASHAEGNASTASGKSSHAEGKSSEASGNYSHSEGQSTHAEGLNAHAEGYSTYATGEDSHAEGNQTQATKMRSHAEGYKTKALANDAHAEGNQTEATAAQSHAEGLFSKAIGEISHAEGNSTTAKGKGAHSEGTGTIATGNYSHVQGKYNIEDTSNKYAHIVGGGTSDSDRKNIHTIDWNGNAVFAGDVFANNKKLATEEWVKNNAGGNVDVSGKLDANGWGTIPKNEVQYVGTGWYFNNSSEYSGTYNSSILSSQRVSFSNFSQDDETCLEEGRLIFWHSRDDGVTTGNQCSGITISGLFNHRTSEVYDHETGETYPAYSHYFYYPNQSGTLIVDKDINNIFTPIASAYSKPTIATFNHWSVGDRISGYEGSGHYGSVIRFTNKNLIDASQFGDIYNENLDALDINGSATNKNIEFQLLFDNGSWGSDTLQTIYPHIDNSKDLILSVTPLQGSLQSSASLIFKINNSNYTIALHPTEKSYIRIPANMIYTTDEEGRYVEVATMSIQITAGVAEHYCFQIQLEYGETPTDYVKPIFNDSRTRFPVGWDDIDEESGDPTGSFSFTIPTFSKELQTSPLFFTILGGLGGSGYPLGVYWTYYAQINATSAEKNIIAKLTNRVAELEAKLNEVETALDRIIQIQNQLMGGN